MGKESTANGPQKEATREQNRRYPKYPGSIVRTILCWLTITIFTPILCGLASLAIILRPFCGSKCQEKVSLTFMRMWMRAVLSSAGVAYTVYGVETLDPNARYVFVSNHTSHLDACCVVSSLPFNVVGLAKKSIANIPLLGWAIWCAGTVFIDRKNHIKAVTGCDKLARQLNESKSKSLWVCPEGTRTPDGRMRPFKKGGLVLAIDTKLPVVPMAVCGAYDVMQKHSYLLHPRPVKIVLGDPISTEGLTYEDRDTLTALVEEKVAGLITKHDTGPAPQDNLIVEPFWRCFTGQPDCTKSYSVRRKLTAE